MSWLRNTLLRLVMSKEALEKMDAYHGVARQEPTADPAPVQPPETTPPPAPANSELARAVDDVVARIARGEHIDQTDLRQQAPERIDPSIGRAALIKKAMAVHRAQQSVLANLDPETRQKLTEVAIQAFFKDKPKS
jgi:predicted component of type VI protein secretion system